jgi:hypothetical protein
LHFVGGSLPLDPSGRRETPTNTYLFLSWASPLTLQAGGRRLQTVELVRGWTPSLATSYEQLMVDSTIRRIMEYQVNSMIKGTMLGNNITN